MNFDKDEQSSKCGNNEVEGPSTTDMLAYLSLAEKAKALSERYLNERNVILENFLSWTEQDQTDFTKLILQRMCHQQHSQIDQYLKPMLQRDFITLLPGALAEHVLSLLDEKSLCASACVSKGWRQAIAHGMLWRKLIEKKVRADSLWRGLSEKRGWKKYLSISKEQATFLIALAKTGSKEEAEIMQQSYLDPHEFQHLFYRELYPQIVRDIRMIENNWRQGNHRLQRINCESENSKGVYCLQYDDEKIVSGLRDNTLKVWRRSDLTCANTLNGHTGSVLCLQFDDKIIASGSSDATIRIWDVKTGAWLNTLHHHSEAVLHLRFQNGMLVTCSKDRSIAAWDMVSPQEIIVRRNLFGHRAAVNVVDFDEKYIVSASGDRTIKVWDTNTCEFVRTLNGHRRGIACLQYRDRLIVSGSSDFSIRLWDIECGNCLRVLEGHEELVRCIRFDSKRIVSGAYDGKIKVWDLQAALDPRTPPSNICVQTLNEHTGRVFRLQFDEFQIVSSSHDDTILIWDFLNTSPPAPTFQVGGPPSSSLPPTAHIAGNGQHQLILNHFYNPLPAAPPHQGSDHQGGGNKNHQAQGELLSGIRMPCGGGCAPLLPCSSAYSINVDGEAAGNSNSGTAPAMVMAGSPQDHLFRQNLRNLYYHQQACGSGAGPSRPQNSTAAFHQLHLQAAGSSSPTPPLHHHLQQSSVMGLNGKKAVNHVEADGVMMLKPLHQPVVDEEEPMIVSESGGGSGDDVVFLESRNHRHHPLASSGSLSMAEHSNHNHNNSDENVTDVHDINDGDSH